MNPKKPLALVRLQGNPGKRRLPTASEEVAAPAGVPGCPDWLGKVARAEWKRVVPLLMAMGLLSPMDRSALAGYCQAIEELSVLAKNKKKTRGDRTDYAKFFGIAKAYCLEFGMTPSARARMSVPGLKAKDAFEELEEQA